MFNAEKAINDYIEYGNKLTDNGKIYYLKDSINVADKLSVIENIIIVNAVKSSKPFIEHKKQFLVPALDARRAERIIRPNATHIADFIEFINSKQPSELDLINFKKYVEYVAKNYGIESFEIIKALINDKKCLNTLIYIAKLRKGGADAKPNTASLVKKAIR